MENQTEEAGAEFLLELIDTIDDSEKAALDAIRRFVGSVDSALPGGGKKGGPRRRVELVEAALNMIEQLLGVSNEIAQRITESVRRALPEIERNAKDSAKQVRAARPPAKKASVKRAARKTPPKKTPVKRAAKKTPPKKTAAKKTAAKKAQPKQS